MAVVDCAVSKGWMRRGFVENFAVGFLKFERNV